MIKLRNDSIKTMMMVILFPVIFFSCIEEEMTCERVPMAVHYVGAGGSVVTRGTEISSACSDRIFSGIFIQGNLPGTHSAFHCDCLAIR